MSRATELAISTAHSLIADLPGRLPLFLLLLRPARS